MAGVARPATKRDENAQASVARPTSVSRAALGARPLTPFPGEMSLAHVVIDPRLERPRRRFGQL